MNRLEKWKGVWERKGRELKKEDLTLRDLIAMDGFDTATGTMTEETWMNVVEMVKRKLNLRKGDFLLEVVTEACELPFKNDEFDAILSFSVFFYFPDYEYAEKVLSEMLRVSKKDAKILIADIPDLSKKEESERHRREALSEEEYNRLYSEHSHLYYDKKWFEDFANKNGLFVEIFDQNIEGMIIPLLGLTFCCGGNKINYKVCFEVK